MGESTIHVHVHIIIHFYMYIYMYMCSQEYMVERRSIKYPWYINTDHILVLGGRQDARPQSKYKTSETVPKTKQEFHWVLN